VRAHTSQESAGWDVRIVRVAILAPEPSRVSGATSLDRGGAAVRRSGVRGGARVGRLVDDLLREMPW
jgi:hypothetical protein